MATQPVINWINGKFSADRNKEDFEQMESFCLLWNLFEKKVGSGNLSTIKDFITNESQNINIDNAVMADCYKYFKDRYITTAGVTNEDFENLKFRDNKREKDFRDKLENILINGHATVSENERILGILTIAWRIRNNTFHGTKELPEIARQADTFKYLNEFLMQFLNGFNLLH
jgi:hypothetical protein